MKIGQNGVKIFRFNEIRLADDFHEITKQSIKFRPMNLQDEI